LVTTGCSGRAVIKCHLVFILGYYLLGIITCASA
jgi:hypothetical protein